MKEITSASNDLIKNLVKLKRKKYRQQKRQYMIEGYHLLGESSNAGLNYRYLLATAAAWQKIEKNYSKLDAVRSIKISPAVAKKLSATSNSQDVFMVLPIQKQKPEEISGGKWVLLDNLQDPGNVGTIIRTADAAGFNGVILSPESVDIYNSKTQRAMQGSQFHIRLQVQPLSAAITELQDKQIPVYASMLDPHAKKLSNFVRQDSLALIIGNEAHGVSDRISRLANEKLYIPIKGKAESLNAAVAAGIMIYHFA